MVVQCRTRRSREPRGWQKKNTGLALRPTAAGCIHQSRGYDRATWRFDKPSSWRIGRGPGGASILHPQVSKFWASNNKQPLTKFWTKNVGLRTSNMGVLQILLNLFYFQFPLIILQAATFHHVLSSPSCQLFNQPRLFKLKLSQPSTAPTRIWVKRRHPSASKQYVLSNSNHELGQASAL